WLLGSSFKCFAVTVHCLFTPLSRRWGVTSRKRIFEENVQVGLVGWAQKVKNKRELKAAASNGNERSSQAGPGPDSGSGSGSGPSLASGPRPGAGAGFAGIQLSRLRNNAAGIHKMRLLLITTNEFRD
ncbi:hypothetical protein AALP_AAs52895U000100, partial [Arabis alpina]